MKNTLVTIMLILTTLVSNGQTSTVYFEKDSYSLSKETIDKLDSLIEKTKQSISVNEIGIIGHTDSDASFEYNKNLSLQRARAVKEYLKSNGLINRFHVLSKSESELVNDSNTELEKAKNRRVEIILDYSTNNSVYESLKTDFQEYSISPNLDTLITCKDGTILKIEQGVFNLLNDTSNLTIRVKEFYNKSDFLASNLTTLTSDNALLESRGMINIEVYQANEKIQIKENKALGIVFKDRRLNDNTSLFQGEEHNNEIVWNQTNSSTASSNVRGWTKTWIGTDTIQRTRWWYETIGDEIFKIEHFIEKDGERIDTTSVESEILMKELILSSPKLGWINCDRFYNATKMDLIVEFNEEFTPDVSLVFDEINSVLPYSYREDNKLIFKNVPVNMKIRIIGLYKKDKDSDIYFANKECISRAETKEYLHFELMSQSEIQNKISRV